MIDPQEDVELFSCQCHHLNHLMRFMFFKDDKDYLYIEVSLYDKMPFLKRVVQAFKYIFGRPCGSVDSVILEKADAIRMRDAIGRFVE